MLQKSDKCKHSFISRCMEQVIAHQLLEQVIANVSWCELETITGI